MDVYIYTPKATYGGNYLLLLNHIKQFSEHVPQMLWFDLCVIKKVLLFIKKGCQTFQFDS